MLGIIIPILITYYVYKNAKENGRNAVLWAVINVAVILTVQIGVGIIGAIFMAVALGDAFNMENPFAGYDLLVNLIGVALSLFASYLVYRHVTRVPDDKQFTAPPPPPTFN